jgi:hypothetical protein
MRFSAAIACWRSRAFCFRAWRRLTVSVKASLRCFFRKASIETLLRLQAGPLSMPFAT